MKEKEKIRNEYEYKDLRICEKGLQIESCRKCLFETLCHYENIKNEAIKYNTKTEFFKGNQTAYRAALKLGIIDDFFLNDYIQY